MLAGGGGDAAGLRARARCCRVEGPNRTLKPHLAAAVGVLHGDCSRRVEGVTRPHQLVAASQLQSSLWRIPTAAVS